MFVLSEKKLKLLKDWVLETQLKIEVMFTSYCIGFCSILQNYTVWCEHTFPSIFMLSMSLKTLDIILMSFDGKNNYLRKNKRKYSNSNNKRMSKVLKIDFVLSDNKIQFLRSWLIQILVVIVAGSHY